MTSRARRSVNIGSSKIGLWPRRVANSRCARSRRVAQYLPQTSSSLCSDTPELFWRKRAPCDHATTRAQEKRDGRGARSTLKFKSMRPAPFVVLGVLGHFGCGGSRSSDTPGSEAADLSTAFTTSAGMASTTSGSGGANGAGGSGTPGAGNTGSAATADAGGAGGSGSSGSGAVCVPNEAFCRVAAPKCPEMLVPAVEGSCWGECVPIGDCVCSGPEDCPDANQYTCHNFRSRCGPYL
jgi:hypothetical protein